MIETKVKIVRSYLDALHRNHELVKDLRTSSLSRLVWFAGLAGFGLLNAKSFWEFAIEHKISDANIVWLSLPLIFSLICSVVTHFLVDETAVKDDLYYTNKVSMLELLIFSLEDGENDTTQFPSILNDTDPELKKYKKCVDRIACWTRWLERASFGLLVLGFIWVIVGPIVLL